MSTTGKISDWRGRSRLHVVFLMGLLTMWPTGAGLQSVVLGQGNNPVPEACCYHELTGGCVLTTEADCSCPWDTWADGETTCPSPCPRYRCPKTFS